MEDVKLPRRARLLLRAWGRSGPINGGPKRWRYCLNNSVLTKMPRDYTDPNPLAMYSPRSARVSHTMQKRQKQKPSRSGVNSKSKKRNSVKSVRGAPAAINLQTVTSLPAMVPKPRADALVTVRHQEYVASVNGSTTQSTVKLDINPGLSTTFPWLSNVARNYESYSWRSLSFEFIPEVGTQTKGRIMMVCDYDARDGVVSDFRRLGSMHGAVLGTIWSPLRLTCDKADLSKSKQYYVRNAAISSTDIKTYDTMSLQYNVGGTVDANVYGCIRATYTVDLMTPQVEDDAAYATSKKIENLDNPTVNVPFANAVVTGGAPVEVDTSPTDSYIRFPSIGEWLLDATVLGVGLTSGYLATTVTSGAATDTGIDRVMDGLSSTLKSSQKLIVTAAPAIIKFTLAGATSVSAVKLLISQWDYHL